MQPLSGNQRPYLLTALMNMSLVLRLPRKMHLCRSSSNVRRLPSFLEMLQNPHVLLRCTLPCACHAKRHLNVQKCSEPPQFFCTFDFEMCFAPQQRALFWHLNFQKWSEPGVFCTFWLRNVLRATTACTFSTSQVRKVLWTWGVFTFFTGFHWQMCFAPQQGALFRHLNFQKWSEHSVFCTFWLRNVLRATTTCNFSSLIWPAGSAPAALASLLFDPGSPKSLEKHSVSRLSYLFSHLHLLSSETFSFLIFFLLLFADSSHLCFSSVHIVGSLTSKLPSIIRYVCYPFISIIISTSCELMNPNLTVKSQDVKMMSAHEDAKKCSIRYQ